MSIKSTKRQVQGDKTFSAATAPLAPMVLSYIITGTDDTALDPAGGQTIILKGVGFKPGATIMLGLEAIGTVTYVDTNTLSFTSPAHSAGTYSVYVTNTDYGTGILTPGVIYSTFPTWTTPADNQGSYYETTSINNTFTATSDTSIQSYVKVSGDFPPDATLNESTGVLSGTAAVTNSSTSYTFVLKATDSEFQDSTRSFNITLNPDVVAWTSPSEGESYSLTGGASANVPLTASSAAGYAVSYTANALPTGLTLDSGTITGVPTVEQTVTTLLTATSATTNRSATRTINWVVALGDTYWKQVVLSLSSNTPQTPFTKDSSINNHQVNANGDVKPSNFDPYTTGYYSNYFNGTASTGNYQTIANTSVAAFGTGDFTIEMWVYMHTSITGRAYGVTLLDSRPDGVNGSYFSIGYDGANVVGATIGNTSVYGPGTAATNRWYHLAVTRSGTSLKFFVDGVSGTAATDSTNLISDIVKIGTNAFRSSATDTYFPGYITNLRLVKGTALYTSNFTPPTTPLTLVSGTTLLTCQSNRITDCSVSNAAITNFGSTVMSAHPFARPTTASYDTLYSTYTDTSSSMTIPASANYLFSAEFTIEAWINITNAAFGSVQAIFGSQNGGNYFDFRWFTTRFQISLNAGSGTNLGGTLTSNTWTHVALVRNAGIIKLYVNGVASATTITNSATLGFSSTVYYIGATATGSNRFTGCISNLRVVKDTAVYTSDFTPSTSPLTAISGTSLLTCQSATLKDNSTNNVAITSTGQARPVAVSPFALTSSSTTVTSLGSAYFDGTGDYISWNPASAGKFGTGDFTVELWFYPTATMTTQYLLEMRDASNTTGWALAYGANVSGSITWYNGTGNLLTETSPLTSINQWNHVAFSRSGTSNRLFINGVQTNITVADSTNYNNTNTTAYIGSRYDQNTSVTSLFTGYISDVRIVKGTALYIANFLLPQAPLTPVTNTQLLTCQYNGGSNNIGIVDQSNFNNIVTRAGSTAPGTFSPYSQTGWSTYFNGSSWFSGTAPTALSTSDFTIEFWYYPLDVPSKRALLQYGTFVILDVSSVINTWLGSGGPTGPAVSLNSWNHIAAVRISGTLKVYVNGVSGTGASFGNDASTSLVIGYETGSSSAAYGYMSNVRVDIGSGVYTSSPFTPSTIPLTVNSKTVILTCQDNRMIDNSAKNVTFTVTGTPSIQAYSPFGGVTRVPKSYSTKFNGTSGSYCTFTGKSSLALGTGDFTIESWVYRNTTTGAGGSADAWYTGTRSPTGSGGIGIKITNGGQLAWNTNASYGTGTTVIPAFTWAHIAVTRESGTLKWYINGVLDYSISMPNNYSNPIAAIGITDDPYYSTLSISNFRLVTGTAVYTGNFTPPTGPLTAIANTALLTCQDGILKDNSSTPATLTVYGTAQRQTAFNPFGTTTTSSVSYTPSSIGGSMYFDGTGDYLRLATSSLAVILGDFTIEGWLYPPSQAAKPLYTLGAEASGRITFYINSSGQLAIGRYGIVTDITFTNIAASTNEWTHFVFSRTGSTINAFLNGILAGSTTLSGTLGAGTQVSIFTSAATDAYGTGYLSDLRITYSALYTSNFVPPNAPLTSTNQTSLLLPGTSSGLIDNHGSNNLETVNNIKIANEDPFGGNYYSTYFAATSDKLSIASTPALGIIFTIEMWVKPMTAPSNQSFYIGGTSSGPLIGYNGATFSVAHQGAWSIAASTNPTVGSWNHVALVREGNSTDQFKLYLNGVLVGTGTDSTTFDTQTGGSIGNIVGYISNLRIVDGTALYTSTFTPSSTPLTAIAGTELLACRNNITTSDGSASPLTLTASAGVAVSSTNPFRTPLYTSYQFDGTTSSSYINIANKPNFTFTGNFTIEGWMYLNSYSGTVFEIGTYQNGILFRLYGSTDTYYVNNANIGDMKTYFPLKKWHHFAIVRTGTSVVLYANGTSVNTTTVSGTINSSAGQLRIGASNHSLGDYFNGYLNGFRITNGVVRYSSAFTPPTTPPQIN